MRTPVGNSNVGKVLFPEPLNRQYCFARRGFRVLATLDVLEECVAANCAATFRASPYHQRMLLKGIQAHRSICPCTAIQAHCTSKPVSSLPVEELPVDQRAVPAAKVHE